MARKSIRVALFPVLAVLAALTLVVSAGPAPTCADDKPATGPSHRVIVCYFHRTERCPTCQKISAYVEESVKAGFASELKDGSVKLLMIDFEDAKNQRYTKAYGIEDPTLVLMDVRDGKVKAWKPAPKVWNFIGDKDQFVKYVQGEVRSYLAGNATASR